MAKIYGYARVSKDEQDWQLQIDALIDAGVDERDIFKEKMSGAKDDRPVLKELLDTVRTGDQVVCYKIDRLGRSLSHLIRTIELLHRKGVHLRLLDLNIDTSTPQGMLVYQMFGAVAEFERALIRERSIDGQQSAKAQGKHIGRPGIDPQVIQDVYDLKDAGRTTADIMRMTGLKKATVYKYLGMRRETNESGA